MTKIKFNKKKSEEIAIKLEQLWEYISDFTDEEMDYLKQVSRNIDKEQGNLRAVGGILVDLDKADAKIKLGEQARNRIKGILLIKNALNSYWKINLEYAKKKKGKEKLDALFNL